MVRIAIICGLFFSSISSYAGVITLTDLGASFTANGGTTTAIPNGIGTGSPVTGSTPNTIVFSGLAETNVDADTFTADTDILLGTITFQNGRTTTGTSASGFEYLIGGTATLNGNFGSQFLDNEQIPVRSILTSVGLDITPNTTGDAILDSDFWNFPGLAEIGVPEDESREILIFGRLVPQNVSTVPEFFELQITSLLPGDGLALNPADPVPMTPVNPGSPVPEPPLALLGVLLLGAGQVLRKRQLRTA